jgi:hypothetical protein
VRHNSRTSGTNRGGTEWYRSAQPVTSCVASRPLRRSRSSRRSEKMMVARLAGDSRGAKIEVDVR